MPEHLSEFDKMNIERILEGMGNWFSADLLRLIAKADFENRAKLRLGFPEHVLAYEKWAKGGSDES